MNKKILKKGLREILLQSKSTTLILNHGPDCPRVSQVATIII